MATTVVAVAVANTFVENRTLKVYIYILEMFDRLFMLPSIY